MTLLRLIATDLDGTLLTSDHELSPATIKAISAATGAGIEVVLASSRGPTAMRRIIERLELTAPVEFISAQGALVGRFHPDGQFHILQEEPIPLELAREVVAIAGRLDISVNWIRGPAWLVSRFDDATEHQISVLQDLPTRRDLAAEIHPPHKILLILPDAVPAAVMALLDALPAGLSATLSHPTFVEITAAGVDKGAALRRLCASRGISSAEVVAIGDGQNDLGMFAFAGTSIAMANAAPDVLALATMATSSNDEDGVADAISALLDHRLRATGA